MLADPSKEVAVPVAPPLNPIVLAVFNLVADTALPDIGKYVPLVALNARALVKYKLVLPSVIESVVSVFNL